VTLLSGLPKDKLSAAKTAAEILMGIHAEYQTPIETEFGPGEISWLRLALNTLEHNMPMELDIAGIDKALKKLRMMLQELELKRFRCHGPIGYLLVTPLAPDTCPDFAATVTRHIEALDHLGQIVRLE
jgi:hypothetical protein